MPTLLIVCGYMGSGKSTVAREISKRTGAVHISSDAVRKQLAGLSPTEHRYEGFGRGIYSPEFSKKTYHTMLENAKERLKKGEDVIIDATFSKVWQRSLAKEIAQEVDATFLCVEVTCPDEIIKERMEKRMLEGGDISDGRWELFPNHKASFEKIDELEKNEHILIDTSKDWKGSIEKVVKLISR